jgi:hypothetical protein
VMIQKRCYRHNHATQEAKVLVSCVAKSAVQSGTQMSQIYLEVYFRRVALSDIIEQIHLRHYF